VTRVLKVLKVLRVLNPLYLTIHLRLRLVELFQYLQMRHDDALVIRWMRRMKMMTLVCRRSLDVKQLLSIGFEV
jgi:hypothetical protein